MLFKRKPLGLLLVFSLLVSVLAGARANEDWGHW